MRILRAVSLSSAALGLLALAVAPASAQQFLDITSLTTGTNGSFTGTLGGVTVAGAITSSPGSDYQFNPSVTGSSASYFDSVIDNTSPQYSYSNIYTPSQALTDQIGSTKFTGSDATVTFTFSAPVTNVVFDAANIDNAGEDFSATSGLTGLALLSGNGGAGDGLTINGTIIQDADPSTAAALPLTTSPSTTGGRSGYGSVELLGTYTTLIMRVHDVGSSSGDGGNFTLSLAPAVAPEPSSVALLLAAAPLLPGIVAVRRRRHKQQMPTGAHRLTTSCNAAPLVPREGQQERNTH